MVRVDQLGAEGKPTAEGASAKQVQVWAGHRSVATVFDRYGHLFPGGEDPVMDSLDAAASLPPR